MAEICNDNRFELIEEFKKKLIDSTNIETSQEEMNVIDNILFRFWQMGWLESIDRMPLVKESAKTLMRSVGDSASAKAFRNAGRFMQNTIDGEAQEYEFVQASSEIPNNSDTISRQDAKDAVDMALDTIDHVPEWVYDILLNSLDKVPSAESEPMCINLNEPIKVKLTDWGKTIGDGRPLADSEVIPRLQDIKRQIGGSYAIERAIEVLEELPSAESEIIRCKNCKHRDSNDCPMYYEEWIEIDEGDGYFDTDTIIHDPTTDEGFCHCAELRGKEDE